MILHVIFVWSGTLVDDLPAVWRATNDVFKQAGVPELTLDQFRAEFCLPFKNFYSRHVPHVTLPQLEQWFHGHFKEVQHLARELPHAREMLQFCHRRRLRTFLLSTIHRDHFAAQSATTGFDRFFDHAYIEVRDKRTKILEILERHSLSARETLFVGDMQHDIETARHGGILSCAVLTGYNRLDQLRASQPDLIVEHLGELRGLLERNRLELAEQRPESKFKDVPVCGSSGNAEISPDNSTRTSCSENEVGGLGAPASRRPDAGAPRQERGKQAQLPGILAPFGVALPHGDLRRMPLSGHGKQGEIRRDEQPVVTVGALIFNSAGEALMVRTQKWSNLWGIPGGKIRFGEGSIDALRREIKEETHLEIEQIQFVLAQDCIRSSEFHRDAHFVLLNYTCRCVGAPQVILNEEAQQFRWASLDEALAMPLNRPTRVLIESVCQPGNGQNHHP